MKSIAVVLALVFVGLTEQRRSLNSRKVHCAVSVWSEWSVWSAPAPGGTRTRSREVIRPSRNGGNECPSDLRDEEGRTDAWNRFEVPKKFHNKFLTGQTQYMTYVSSRRASRSKRSTVDEGVITLLPRDLLFIIDMSGSISHGDWRRTKEKLAALIGRLCGNIGRGRQDNRIAIVTFSTNVVLNFNFKTHWTLARVQQAILNMAQDDGMTCTGDAFNYAHKYMFEPDSGIRPAGESVKEVLVLTDGGSNCGAELAASTRRLQIRAFVFALAIGDFNDAGKVEIESMVTRPLIDHIFSLHNFDDFEQMVDEILQFEGKCAPFEFS